MDGKVKDYPFFKMYPASAMMDIVGKSREEIGDYFISLLRAWQNHDIESMPKWMAENVAECQEKSQKRREAANMRWAQNSQNTDANAMQSDANAMQSDANAMQRREEKRREENTTAIANIVVAENSEKLPAVVPSLPVAAKQKKTLEERQREFGESLRPFSEKYPRGLMVSFFSYWTEPTLDKKKMRAEKEKTFEVSRRLATWAANEPKFAQVSNCAPTKSFKQQEQEQQAAKIAEIEAYLRGAENE